PPRVLLLDKAKVQLGGDLFRSRRRAGAGLALLGLGLINQLDALLLQNQEELIELLGIDRIVGQVFVNLTVGQVTFIFARFEQRLQAFVHFQIHQSPPHLITRIKEKKKRRKGLVSLLFLSE